MIQLSGARAINSGGYIYVLLQTGQSGLDHRKLISIRITWQIEWTHISTHSLLALSKYISITQQT